MQRVPRPLPRIPNLTFPVENPPHRPLPTPPLQSSDSSSISSSESIYLQTPPFPDATPPPYIAYNSGSSVSSLYSISSTSSELSPKPRPRLRISVPSPALRKKNSLDSLTVRSPALCDPGQALSPVVDRKNNADLSRSKRSCVSQQYSRASALNSAVSPLVFNAPAPMVGPGIPELEEDEPVFAPRIPQSRSATPDVIVVSRLPQSRSIPTLTNRIGIDYPAGVVRVMTDTFSDSDSDYETEGRDSCTFSSTDLSIDRESHSSEKKQWKAFPNIAKVAIKTNLFRPKTQPTKPCDAPAADAKRVSQMASPMNQTWYKERDGWRWVERDVDEVLAELRKLR